MNIRRMTADDIDILCRLEEECFSDPWHRESFEDMLHNPNALFLVVEEKNLDIHNEEKTYNKEKASGIYNEENVSGQVGNAEELDNPNEKLKTKRVLGYAGMLSVVGEGVICNVAVAEGARGRGLGRAVVQALIDIGKKVYAIDAYTLEVRVNNTIARKLYESLGFICEGIRPGYYDNPKEDAAIYWLINNEERIDGI